MSTPTGEQINALATELSAVCDGKSVALAISAHLACLGAYAVPETTAYIEQQLQALLALIQAGHAGEPVH